MFGQCMLLKRMFDYWLIDYQRRFLDPPQNRLSVVKLKIKRMLQTHLSDYWRFWSLADILRPPLSDTRINRGHQLLISRYHDELSATFLGQIAVFKIFDFFTTTTFLIPSKSSKLQATKYTAFKANSALIKLRRLWSLGFQNAHVLR